MYNDFGMLRSQNQIHVTMTTSQLSYKSMSTNVMDVNVRINVPNTVYCIYP